MKKFFALILAITCVIFSLNTGFGYAEEAEAEASIDSEKYSADFMLKYDLLSHLGIIDDGFLTNANEAITRGEFAKIIEQTLNLASVSDVYFTDTNDSAINTLAAYRYLSVPSDKKFKPSEQQTYFDAVKLCVTALGYGDYAEARGGSESEYFRIGRMIGLTGNKTADGAVKKFDAVELVGKMLLTAEYSISSVKISDEDLSYVRQKKDTLLSSIYDMYFDEGVVTSNQCTSLYDNLPTAEEGQIRINDELYSDKANEYSNLIGQKIKYIYKYTNGMKFKELIVCVTDNQKEWTDIKGELSEIRSGNTVKYYQSDDSDKFMQVEISNAVLVYNGCVNFNVTTEDIKNAVLSENAVTNIYQNDYAKYNMIVIVNDYVNYEVKAYDSARNIIYLKNLKDDKVTGIDIDSIKRFRIISADGEIAEETPGENEIVSAVISNDSSNIELYVCKKSVSGAVKSVSKNENKIIVNDICYKLEKNFAKNNNVSPGSTYTFTLDYLGRIVRKSNSLLPQEYVLSYVYDSGKQYNFDEEVYQYKILTGANEKLIVKTTEKTKLNGADSNPKAVNDALSENGSLKEQLAIVSYNSKNELIEVITCNGDSSNEVSLRLISDKQSRQFFKPTRAPGSVTFSNSTNRMLNYNLYNDTKVFRVPDTSASRESYDNILKAGSIYNDTFLASKSDYNVALYKIGDKSPFIDACVIYTGGKYSPSMGSKCYLVNELYTSLNKNGDNVVSAAVIDLTTRKPVELKIEQNAYFNDGSERLYKRISDIEGYKSIDDRIGPGDIIQIGDGDTNRDYVKLVFDCSEEKTFYGYQNGIYTYQFESISPEDLNKSTSTSKARFTYGGLYKKYVDSSKDSELQYHKNRAVCTVSDLSDISSPKETYTYPNYWELFLVVNPNKRANRAYYGSVYDVPDYCGTNEAEYGKVFSILNDSGGLVASVFYLPKDVR
jgi:hypothetical protein